MKPLSCQKIRELWVEFFTKKCPSPHKHIKSASLVPDNPTLLLNAAGMVQFVPIFMGTKPPPEPPRAVTVQKCARVGGKDSDLENIGRTTRHHSFFEMLGNFSFGDYFKAEAIPWAWEFVTKELGLPIDKLYVSVFEGDEQNPFDQEAYDHWQKIIPEDRIWKMTRKDNFWGPPGETGPCGPCSEIYYEVDPSAKDFDDRYTEIWNLVFMEFFKDENANFTPLEKKNIDTGAGLERIATILQGVNNTFETDELKSILDNLASRLNLKYGENAEHDLYLKIITDHVRCATFLIADGVIPSNVGRGYVLRMIIRRAARFLYLLRGEAGAFLYEVSDAVVAAYQKAYKEIGIGHSLIATTIQNEEAQFAKTLEQGIEVLNKKLATEKSQNLDGAFVFDLYSTYGFPLELTQDMLESRGVKVDLEGFKKAQEKHAQASGSGAVAKSVESNAFVAPILKNLGGTIFLGYDELEADCKVVYSEGQKLVLDRTPFYAESGGQLADQGYINDIKVIDVKSIEGVFVHTLEAPAKFQISEVVKAKIDKDRREFTLKHHTSCHLLQAALRQVLGENIQQMGSQVGPEYTRFDFNLDRSMTKEEIKKTEDIINNWIKADLAVETKVMDYDDAVTAGALSFFEDKYDDEVRVLFIGNEDARASIELCGGTHVAKLSEIKNITIATEGSIASGIRRIKLLAHKVADEHLAEQKELAQKQAQEEAQKAQEKDGETNIAILETQKVFAQEYDSETIKAFVEALIDKNKAEGNDAFILSRQVNRMEYWRLKITVNQL